MLVGILYGDENRTAPRRRRSGPLNLSDTSFRFGGRGVVPAGYSLGSDEPLAGIGSFTKRTFRKTKNVVGNVLIAPVKAASYVIRAPTHGVANIARGIGGSVFGTTRSLGRSAAAAAPGIAAGLAAVYGGQVPQMPGASDGALPPTVEEAIQGNKKNTALTYGIAGGGALVLGLLIFALSRRK